MYHLLVDWTPTAACVMRKKTSAEPQTWNGFATFFPFGWKHQRLRQFATFLHHVENTLFLCCLGCFLFSFLGFRFFLVVVVQFTFAKAFQGLFCCHRISTKQLVFGPQKKRSLKALHFPLALKHIYRSGVFINLIGNKVPNVITQNYFSFH